MNSEIKENKDLVLFENQKIRRQEYSGEWYYSIVDIVGVLIQQKDNETAITKQSKEFLKKKRMSWRQFVFN